MDKLEYRAVIRFLVLEGVSPVEIQARMQKVYGDSSTPSCSTIKKWAAEFKKGRTSIRDEPREGRPKCATGLDIVQKVAGLIQKDTRLKVREIADEIEVSTGSAFEILTKKLKMRKLFGRWVTASLTAQQKLHRKTTAAYCLKIFKEINLNSSFITLAQTWIHIYEPQQTKDAAPPEPKLKKASSSSDKLMALIFWDANGILFSSFASKDEAINSAYLVNLLSHFNLALNEKRPHRLKELTYFYSDLTEFNEDELVLSKLNELNYKLLKQPALSPDLSPSDTHLFPKLENYLQAKRPTTVDEAIEAVEHYFYDLPENNFRVGIEFLEKRFSDCIKLDGNYVEPNAVISNNVSFAETEEHD